jgi:uncharacterized protein
MSSAAWREAVIEYIRGEAKPVDKFGHMPRLYALAVRLGEGTEYDDDVLFAAVWMHDLGVFIGHRPADPAELARWNHVPYTIAKARELLPGWGFPSEKLDAVAETIRTHQPQDIPSGYEAVLLRDADILEQLGAVGTVRAVAKIGRDTRFATLESAVAVLRRAADSLPALIRTERAQQLALERVKVLRCFITAIDDEAGSLLY